MRLRFLQVFPFLLLLVVLGIVSGTQAATFMVTKTADTNGTCSSGVDCSFREAITAANDEGANPGADIINFAGGVTGTINLSTALPDLTSNITITGPGASSLTIARSSVGGTPDFSIFIIAASQTIRLNGLTISNGNTIPTAGGGIYNNGILTINGCTLSDNHARGANNGGAIFQSSTGLLTINNSTFLDNSARNGGGVYNSGGIVTINNSTFNGNSCSNAGGAIRNSNAGTLTVNNSTLSGNSASNVGGGIYNDSTVTIRNCTITGNRADANGDGPASGNGGGLAIVAGTRTLNNSIVAGNFTGTGTTPDDVSGGASTANNNLIGDAATSGGIANGTSGNIVGVNGSGTRDTNTILDTTLASNGGPTKTHALVGNSPAFNAGSNSLIPPDGTDADGDSNTTEATPFDQRGSGFPRIRVGTVDIGAYESSFAANESLAVTTLTDEDNDSSDPAFGSGTSLREAINYARLKSGDDTITFQNGLTGTIQLGSALPNLNSNLTINGPGAGLLTVRRDSGGIYRIFAIDNSSTVSISGLTLTRGDAGIGDYGGAIYNLNGNVTITGCILRSNSSGVYGGAVFNLGTITLQNSTISGSVCDAEGGGLFNAGTMTLRGCTVNNNYALHGGGVYNSYILTLQNSTFSGNYAADYGGGVCNQLVAYLQNSTITRNYAEFRGGGVLNIGLGNSSTQASHSIIADNASSDVDYDTSYPNTFQSQGYNLIGSGNATTSFNQSGDQTGIIDPRLGPLRNNGGLTYTHALLEGSPAFNAGDPAFNPNNFTPVLDTDQRGAGYPRVQNGRIDIGAYEAPVITINDVTISEGNSGTTNLDFTVSLSSLAPQTVTVQYATQNGTATAPDDYTAASGTLTFNAGQSSKTISIAITGDTLDEINESFKVNLSNATGGALITDSQGIATINDDDPSPSISINDVSVNETNGGSVQAQFTLTLSAPSSLPVSIVAQSSSSAGSPAATVSVDYLSAPAATLTFAPGQTTKTFNVTVLGDIIDEADEKFAVSLSGATNATVSDNTGVVTIIDNDDPPTVSVSAPNTTEGNTGDTPTMTFTISLSAASARNISVQYQTAGASTFPATSGTDYTAVPLTTVIFAPGETTKTVNVTVKGDNLDEDNERIKLNLQNPVNATLGTISEGVIIDDDATPELSISDAQVIEGNTGTKQMIFTITLSAVTGRTVTVNAATGNGGSPAATADSDYVALASTPITFTPGQTSKQVSITINGDTTVEPNEKLAVILSGAINATLVDNSGIGTIINDDSAPLRAPSGE